MTVENMIPVIGGTLTGLLFAFNVAVVPALRTMQSINHKLKNPVFCLSFFASASVLAPMTSWLRSLPVMRVFSVGWLPQVAA